MFLIQNYWTAIAFCIVTMVCWGSWANTQKLVDKKWRYELFYWDYVFGLLLTALIFALTWGSNGTSVGRSYIDDLTYASPTSLGWALAGGVVFNIANILLVSAIDIAGMAVAFPVGIGLALVLGVVWNFLANPASSGNPVFLFVGVALVAAAIIISALSYKKRDAANVDPDAPKKPIGKGLALSILCGLLMSLFYFFVAKSLARVQLGDGSLVDLTIANLQNGSLEMGKLTPYTANLVFAVGILLSNCIIMPILMAKPLVGDPVEKGSYWTGSFRNHFWGWVGGAIWAVGMTFNVLASGIASPAVAYGLGQGATLMSAIWGVFIWREFRNSPKGVGKMLAGMFLCFIVGLALIVVTKLDSGAPAAAAEPTPAVEAPAESEAVPEASETGSVIEQLTEDAQNAAQAVKDSAEQAIDSAKEAAGDAVDAAKEAAESAKDAASDAVDAAKEKAGEAVDAVKEATGDAVDAAKEKAGDAIDAAKEAAESAKDAASDAIDAAKEKTGEAVDAMKEATGDAVDAAKEATSSAVESAKEAAGDAVDAVKNAAESAKDAAADAIESVKDAVSGANEAPAE
ncbi:MAG: hypothetical protein II561_07750 [Thermoguttaceae bacterium]|nr:hypothetical protein [Thermoguttaceae bacterium]MBQ3821677.1 hypothetical protein [Thermoguttaceae bacterium]